MHGEAPFFADPFQHVIAEDFCCMASQTCPPISTLELGTSMVVDQEANQQVSWLYSRAGCILHTSIDMTIGIYESQ